jgi:hypothetical protein
MSLELEDLYVESFHRARGEDANEILVHTAVPFRTGPVTHVARLTLPFTTESPLLDDGLGDMRLVDLAIFERKPWRVGLGPAFLFPSGGSNQGTGKWSAGPAVGFTAQSGRLLWGGFNYNLFSFAGSGRRPDVEISVLRPIASWHLGRRWFVSPSPMQFTWSWEVDDWLRLPLGGRLTKLVTLLDAPIQLGGYYEYDFADARVAPRHTLALSVKVLFVRRTLRRLGLM